MAGGRPAGLGWAKRPQLTPSSFSFSLAARVLCSTPQRQRPGVRATSFKVQGRGLLELSAPPVREERISSHSCYTGEVFLPQEVGMTVWPLPPPHCPCESLPLVHLSSRSWSGRSSSPPGGPRKLTEGLGLSFVTSLFSDFVPSFPGQQG